MRTERLFPDAGRWSTLPYNALVAALFLPPRLPGEIDWVKLYLFLLPLLWGGKVLVWLARELPRSSGEILSLVLGDQEVGSIEKGTQATVILDQTPFYAESGGQVGDVGHITNGAAHFRVENTFKYGQDLMVHKGRLEEGELQQHGDAAPASGEEHGPAGPSDLADDLSTAGLEFGYLFHILRKSYG